MLKIKEAVISQETAEKTTYTILLGISFSHLLNDTIQSLIPSVYPILKNSLNLSFAQLGLITLAFQLTASLLQPLVGLYTDKKPKPFSLATGMGFTLLGLVLLSLSNSFYHVLFSVAFVGIGSSIFHPEASRLAYMASGGKRGMAQSLFQVGGNAGSAIGPLLAALIVVPYGQFKIIWFSLIAFLAIIVLYNMGKWYQANVESHKKKSLSKIGLEYDLLPKKTIIKSMAILLLLMFSKYFYTAGISSYLTFFMMDKFGLSIQSSQMYLFLFLASAAAGTFLGGPIGDRYGRKFVIWFSILGAAPFTLLLPYSNLFWTSIFIVFIGFILSSAFSAILVYAQELIPGKVGLIAGLFFGMAFGLGGIGSAVLGHIADLTGIQYIFRICAFLPLLGLLTYFLPDIRKKIIVST
jgi:MFS transporter, FSR family, fosmidomycin resistance protein